MNKEELRDAFLGTREIANIEATLSAFDNVISSGTISSDTLIATLPFEYTY